MIYKEMLANGNREQLYVNEDIRTKKFQSQVAKVSLKPGNKSFTIIFAKVDNAKNYEIRYSTDKKMKKTTSVTATKATIKKLSSKTRYYVQVRASYTGCKSQWSKILNVMSM